MSFRNRIASSFFLRNMLGDLFGRNVFDKGAGMIVPYFQYKVGVYERGFTLSFSKEPTARQYRNEVFNKAGQYLDSGVGPFLDFHYQSYGDRQDFLRFLSDSALIIAGMRPGKNMTLTLAQVGGWVKERKRMLEEERAVGLRSQVEDAVRQSLNIDDSAGAYAPVLEGLTSKLALNLEKIIADAAGRMETASASLPTGSIEFSTPGHEERLMLLFKMLQEVRAPKGKGHTEQLFSKFDNIDIASILRLHFAAFRDKKINTLQGWLRKAGGAMGSRSSKTAALEKALQDFFY